eukprot:SAG11_NODE_7670_length_1112_cov_1.320829_1_plen_228_part_00
MAEHSIDANGDHDNDSNSDRSPFFCPPTPRLSDRVAPVAGDVSHAVRRSGTATSTQPPNTRSGPLFLWRAHRLHAALNSASCTGRARHNIDSSANVQVRCPSDAHRRLRLRTDRSSARPSPPPTPCPLHSFCAFGTLSRRRVAAHRRRSPAREPRITLTPRRAVGSLAELSKRKNPAARIRSQVDPLACPPARLPASAYLHLRACRPACVPTCLCACLRVCRHDETA